MDSFRLMSVNDLRIDERTMRCEGKDCGAGISFLISSEDRVGAGPGLHKHPYSETWIVEAGRGRFTSGDQHTEVGPGNVGVVGPNTPHRFINLGPDPLKILCIHACERFITEWLTA